MKQYQLVVIISGAEGERAERARFLHERILYTIRRTFEDQDVYLKGVRVEVSPLFEEVPGTGAAR